ncbi:MAG: SUMF1/EgtB/PvdO family nonheme iron enzyme [Treponema sp.]|nr:SUMF1/EgtB/PvdO family nonheme iron enzyme [Treponema sp.]
MRFIIISIFALLIVLTACTPSEKKEKSDEAILAVNNAVQENNSIIKNEAVEISTTITTDNSEKIQENEKTEETSVLIENNVSVEPAKTVDMVLVRGGSFQIGSEDGELDERPIHRVTINSFYIGKYEVTQKEWNNIMGNNPSSFKGENLPVENVSWLDVIDFCNRLSIKDGFQPVYQREGNNVSCNFAANGYRLPTEAEWEYAARSGSGNIDAIGWYNVNSYGKTNEVGKKTPNSFGIFDMSGNVSEWCWDLYGPYSNNESSGSVVSSTTRVVRGGNWGSSAWDMRVTARSHFSATTRNSGIGFRVVRIAL